MTQDTRKDRRVKIVSLNVRYKSATVDEFIDNHALDVSRGGIYVKTGSPFPPGTLLKFEIRLASDQAVITGVGRVVWKRDAPLGSNDRPAGMGVKFIKVDDPSRALIDKLVNTRTDAGKAFEAEPEARTSTSSLKRLQTPQGVHAATRVGTPSSPAIRKGTMVGLGNPVVGSGAPVAGSSRSSSVPPAGSAARASSAPPAGSASSFGGTLPLAMPSSVAGPREGAPGTSPSSIPPSNRAGRSLPPRPGGPASMFPKTQGSQPPAKGEATVMKQAAELLEEALREAGGSAEEVGTNPLFSGTASLLEMPPLPPEARAAGPSSGDAGEIEAAEAAGDAVPELVDPGPEPAGLDPEAAGVSPAEDGVEALLSAEPLDEAANARAMVAAMSPGQARPPRADIVRAESPSGGRPDLSVVPRAGGRTSVPPPALAAGSDAHAFPVRKGDRQGGGAGKWIFVALLLVVAGVVFAFRDRLLGSSETPTSAPTPSVSAPAASAPPSAEAAPSAAPSPEAPTALPSSTAASAPSATASAAPSSPPSKPAPAPRSVYIAPKPRPAPSPAAVAAPEPSSEATSAPTAAAAATATSKPVDNSAETTELPPAPTTKPTATAAPSSAPATSATARGRASARGPDDNPY